MATPGELSSTVARLLGISEPTVRVHDHNLAAAGLRSTGGRGRSAAKMTPADAAALLITTLASPSLRESLETFRNYARLSPQRGTVEVLEPGISNVPPPSFLTAAWDLRFMPIASIKELGTEHTFMEFLTAVIAATVSGELKLAAHKDQNISPQFSRSASPRLNIKLLSPVPSADVSIRWNDIVETRSYRHSARGERKPVKPINLPKHDRGVDVTFTDRTIYAISKLLRGEAK